MVPAVWKAAEIAHALEGRVLNHPKAGEETAVKQALTAADTQSQEAVLESLLQHFPGVSLAAEEDTPSVSSFPIGADSVVVIDPIDGTLRSYLEGGGPYTVIVGLAWRREYQASLIALPREGLLFYATRGKGAFMSRAGGRARPVRVLGEGDRVLVSNGMPARVCDRLRERGLEAVPSSGGAVSVAPLIPGVRAGLRYAGSELGLSIRGRVGALIAAEAGARLCGDGGRPFPLDMDTPCQTLRVAANEDDLEILEDALAAAALG